MVLNVIRTFVASVWSVTTPADLDVACATPSTQGTLGVLLYPEWHSDPVLGLRDQGEGEPTPAGPDSSWSWSSFPVGNSELPPATAAGKGRLSHLRQGCGVPPTPHPRSAHCSHTQSPLLAHGQLPAQPPCPAQPGHRQGRKERSGGRGLSSPHPRPKKGEKACPPATEQGRGSSEVKVGGEGSGREPATGCLVTADQAPSEALLTLCGCHCHPIDRSWRGRVVSPRLPLCPQPH